MQRAILYAFAYMQAARSHGSIPATTIGSATTGKSMDHSARYSNPVPSRSSLTGRGVGSRQQPLLTGLHCFLPVWLLRGGGVSLHRGANRCLSDSIRPPCIRSAVAAATFTAAASGLIHLPSFFGAGGTCLFPQPVVEGVMPPGFAPGALKRRHKARICQVPLLTAAAAQVRCVSAMHLFQMYPISRYLKHYNSGPTAAQFSLSATQL